MTLRRVCGARHIKPFRLRSDIGDLVPLRAYDPIADDQQLSARIGIIGHVVTSGRSFSAGDAAQGALVAQLAADAPQPVTWCFPIKQGAQRFGVVVVSELDGSVEGEKPLLRACEKLVNIWWLTVRGTQH
jgi:hypothetical protein